MRLTKARVERWQKDLERADELLERVENEARQYRSAAKGSKLQHLTGFTGSIREARIGTPGAKSEIRGGLYEVAHRLVNLRKAMDR